MMKLSREDHAQVFIQAEFVLLISILMGFLLNFFLTIQIPFPKIIRIPLGIVIILTGVIILLLSMERFRKAHTYSSPYKPVKSLITKGPYKRSRHPMYLGRLLQQIGIGVAFGNVWILLMLVPAFIVVWYGVIVPEEQYLERRFGQKYLQYKCSTRCWI